MNASAWFHPQKKVLVLVDRSGRPWRVMAAGPTKKRREPVPPFALEVLEGNRMRLSIGGLVRDFALAAYPTTPTPPGWKELDRLEAARMLFSQGRGGAGALTLLPQLLRGLGLSPEGLREAADTFTRLSEWLDGQPREPKRSPRSRALR